MDREKVLTWLEICGKNNDCSGCCPYSENGFGEYGQCRESLMADAYDMLKKQEAVEPKKGWFLNNLNIPEEHWFCGKCDEELVGKCKYCSNCGQAVKW